MPAPEIRRVYFVLHAEVHLGSTERSITGVMEDLTTGEKREFTSAAAVADLITVWSGLGPKGPEKAS